jgi:hypothetical protein
VPRRRPSSRRSPLRGGDQHLVAALDEHRLVDRDERSVPSSVLVDQHAGDERGDEVDVAREQAEPAVEASAVTLRDLGVDERSIGAVIRSRIASPDRASSIEPIM